MATGPVKRLQHASMPFTAGREPELRAFYGEVLGLAEKVPPEILRPRGVIWFEAGDDELEIHFLPEELPVDRRSGRHFCLQVDDIGETRGRLERAGAEVVDAEDFPHRARFYAYDPFGNMIEFTTITGDYRDV
jgi:catechol 2,3-dioxygenase-like lactoylglutathione lyase family enzyme